jgi:hypothetical protein
MILGFTLPFALAFVAIPLEYFVNAGRIVLGAGLVLAMRSGAFVLRLGANLSRETGRLTVIFYDVLIFAPLAIERWVLHLKEGAAGRNKVRSVPAFGKRASGSEEVV